MHAVKNDHVQVVEMFIGAGADVNSVDKDGKTALMFAAKGGHDKAISALCKAGSDVNNVDVDGWTALMLAADNGHAEMVRMLIEAGADVNSVDKDGSTALMKAVSSIFSPAKVVQILIGAGADVDKINNDGWTALAHAEECEHVEVVALLKEAKKRNFVNSLINVIENGNGEEIKGLLDKGVTLGAIGESSKRVLLRIVGSGHVDMIKTLAHAGAIGEEEKTTLTWVVSENDVEMSRLLVESGADVNERDKRGCTPLMYAAFNENAEMIKMLNDSGANADPADEIEALRGEADVDAIDENRKTALMRAVESGREGLVRMLLKKGADVKRARCGEMTALKCAACNGKAHNVGMRIVDMLLEAGAEVDECEICTELINDGRKPNCGSGECMHLFHTTCLDLWFESSGKNECPKCKAQFSVLN